MPEAMIVCHCFRVSDREIRECARNGAQTVSEVGRACGAGGGCGGCKPEISSLLCEEQGGGALIDIRALVPVRAAG